MAKTEKKAQNIRNLTWKKRWYRFSRNYMSVIGLVIVVLVIIAAVFAEWIDNGHNDLDSTDCIILKIRLTSGILYADGVRHEIDFSKYIYA